MKKLRIINLAALLTVILLASSCVVTIGNNGVLGNSKIIKGNDDCVSKSLSVNDFEKLIVRGSIDVRYCSNSDSLPSVRIEGPSNLVDSVVVEESSDALTIGIDINYTTKKPLIVYTNSTRLASATLLGSGDLSVKNLADIPTYADAEFVLAGSGDIVVGNATAKNVLVKLSGSGDLTINELTTEDVEISLAGSGDVTVKHLESNSLSASLAGSGDIKVAGKTENATFKVAGSGDIDANNLEAQKVSQKVTGSGDIRLK